MFIWIWKRRNNMLPIHGGINFKNNEKTNSVSIQSFTTPERVFLNIPQGYTVNVSVNNAVDVGQVIAFPADEKNSPVYSSISGIIENISSECITIKNDFKNRIHSGLSPVELPLKELSEKEIESLSRLMCIYDGDIPLSQKIKESVGKIENVIISCTDTEPPAGIRFPLLKEFTKELLGGIKILIHATKARRGIITISETNEDFSVKLKNLITDKNLITIRILENKYPLEAPKYLLYALTRKEYQQENLIKDSKCLVLSPESVIALYNSFTTGIPQLYKSIAVSGNIPESKNISVPQGTKISEILNLCTLELKEKTQIINGGIMSGVSINSDDILPIGCERITVLEPREEKKRSCIRCGKCIDSCPMLLKPLLLYSNAINSNDENNLNSGIIHCIECGCCTYVCPSKIPLSNEIIKSKHNVLFNTDK